MKSTYLLFRDVPLVIDYEDNDHGDVFISEVWIKGMRMISLMGNDVLDKLRYEIKRKEGK